MLVDVSRVLVQMNGKSLMDQDAEGNAVEATVRLALVNAVLSPEQNEPGVKKVQKYELARRMYAAVSTVDLNVEDVAMLKKRVEEVYPPLICGQLCAILEGKE